MRQGQQNRRGRGRSNNNNRGGKGHNPLTRTVESNGPDVKIRGNPSHIAEKYITLARDSLSSGDVVMAENYLQHAEHYNRIIMSHREQLQAQQENSNNRNNNRQYSNNNSSQNTDGENTENNSATVRGNEPQPRMNDQRGPRENTRSRRSNTDQRGDRQPRTPRKRRDNEPVKSESANNGAAATSRSKADTNEGSKISDGQETPGFLRNSVAAAPKRRRRTPATETQGGSKKEATASATEKDNA